jgi:hypothetical protein
MRLSLEAGAPARDILHVGRDAERELLAPAWPSHSMLSDYLV